MVCVTFFSASMSKFSFFVAVLLCFVSTSVGSHLIGTDRVVTNGRIEGNQVVFEYDAEILLKNENENNLDEYLGQLSVFLLRRNEVAASIEGLSRETLKGEISTPAKPGLHGYSVIVIDEDEQVVLLSDKPALMVVAPDTEEEQEIRDEDGFPDGWDQPWRQALEPLSEPKIVTKEMVAPLADPQQRECQLQGENAAEENCSQGTIDYTFVFAARGDFYFKKRKEPTMTEENDAAAAARKEEALKSNNSSLHRVLSTFRLLQNTIDHLLYGIARHNLNAEVLFIDYNSMLNSTAMNEMFGATIGTPPLQRIPVNVSVEIAEPGDFIDDIRGKEKKGENDNNNSNKCYRKLPPLRVITVPPSVHTMVKAAEDKVCHKLPVFEYHSKNIAFRRARGKVIITMNGDNLHTDANFESLANPATLEMLMKNRTMIRTYRIDIFERFESYHSIKDRYLQFATWANSLRMLKRGFHGFPQLVSKDDIDRWTKEYNTEAETKDYPSPLEFPISSPSSSSPCPKSRSVARSCAEHHMGTFVDMNERNLLYGSGDFVAASANLWRTVRGYPEGCGQTEHDLFLLCIFVEYGTDIITWKLPCAASHQYHVPHSRTLVNIETESLCANLKKVREEKGEQAIAKTALFTQAYHTPFGEDWGLPEFKFNEYYIRFQEEGDSSNQKKDEL